MYHMAPKIKHSITLGLQPQLSLARLMHYLILTLVVLGNLELNALQMMLGILTRSRPKNKEGTVVIQQQTDNGYIEDAKF